MTLFANQKLLIELLTEFFKDILDLTDDPSLKNTCRQGISALHLFGDKAAPTVHSELKKKIDAFPEIRKAVDDRDMDFFVHLDKKYLQDNGKGPNVLEHLSSIQKFAQTLDDDDKETVWEYVDLILDCVR